ncbi:DEAD/DEAH box helicase [Halobacteriales archaeon SW_6_65_15]|nr:MAG: DEAD/DEAH box helicase [Halobacteriales archaeon SW_6_65_15]
MEVAEAVPDPEFVEVFPFEEFNEMQEEVVGALVETDENVVASAPTASGKTALAELAICRTLQDGGTALFVAPMRALTNEKESEWERFEELGYSVYVVTGERDLNPRRAERADILVMTPEKADSATRKHDSRRYAFIREVDCCVIDEVHLLDSEKRGSVLEVGDDYRPVDLHSGVETYTHGDNSFADKYRRLYRALDLAEPHIRDEGQALVFVSSRQDSVQAAKKARDEVAERDVPMGARGDYDFHNAADDLQNDTLRKSVLDGVAFHHAGLSKGDKDKVEEWFKQGKIQLLFSTSTLAWGVNLPARCVVLRDTKLHDPLEGEVDMSPLDILQMLGRAGRPEYDDVGYGWVISDRAEADKYRRLLREGKEIESRLAEDLDAHLNAEIAMGTIRDLGDVMDWLETTFYFVRARSNPEAYDLDDFRDDLRGRVRTALDRLDSRGFVDIDEADLSISATPLGRLASKFYLRLDTAEEFRDLAEREQIETADVLRTVADAAEFDSVSARQSEREAVSSVLTGQDAGDLDPGARKILAILRSTMTGSTPAELRSDAWVITQNGLRLLAALRAFFERFAGPRPANLARRVEARVEHGVSSDAVGLTAIAGVGSGRASKLAKEGIASPADVREAGKDGLVKAGLSAGVADAVLESARELPRVEVEWGRFPDSISRGENDMREVTVRNESAGAGEQAGIRVTVNGVEMTATTTYLDGEATVPVGVFGGTDDEMEYVVEVSFPELPLLPATDSRTVRVE